MVLIALVFLSLSNQLQLTRAGGFAHGRLVNRLSDDTASSWLVTFDDQDYPDEEIHEEDLGPVVARLDDSDNGGSKNGDMTKPKIGSKKKFLRTTKPTLPAKLMDAKAGSGSDDAESFDSSNKKKRRSSSIDLLPDDRQSNGDTDVSSPNDSSKNASSGSGRRSKLVSDREQRSRRRQQIIEEEPGTGLLMGGHPGGGATSGPSLPPSKKVKTHNGEEVVKIPMLTGTLYLYRGAKRRVAFVRKL